MLLVRFIVAVVAAYLFGALPIGVIVGRLYRGVDIRRYGSGRTGATNVLRTLGPGAALAVAAGDVGKGACAILATHALLAGQPAMIFHLATVGAALAALAGHNWSVFVNFSGGRGVLVTAGTLLVLLPVALAVCVVGAAIAIAVWRFVSLGSIVAAVLGALCILAYVAAGKEPRVYIAFAIIGAAVIILQHRDNIERLRTGTERKLGQSVSIPPPGRTA